jgi:hypothetical protein
MKNIKKIFFNTIVIMSLGLMSFSCTRKNVNVSSDNAQDSIVVNSSGSAEAQDLLKKGDDIVDADYSQFYDDLSPHGKWIKVTPADLGMKIKEKTGDKKNETSSLLNSILGVKDAKADAFVGWDFFFVWQPSPDISVGVVAGEPQPAYVPYVHGRWVYTDRGWYFRAPTYYEEIVHHYGRWCYNDDYGWVWIPGRVWAPAWVRWEEDDDYVGWAPVQTSVYISNNYYFVPQERYSYVTTERRYFLDPEVYRYTHVNKFENDRIIYKDMRRFDGLTVRDRMVINRGPDVKHFEKYYGKDELHPVKINTVNDARNVNFGKNEYNVYAPEYKRKSDIGSSGFHQNNDKMINDKNMYDNKSKLFNENQNGKNKNDNPGLNGNKKSDKNEIYSKRNGKNKNENKTSVQRDNNKKTNGSDKTRTYKGNDRNKENMKNSNRQEKNKNNVNKNNSRDKSFGTKKPTDNREKNYRQEKRNNKQDNNYRQERSRQNNKEIMRNKEQPKNKQENNNKGNNNGNNNGRERRK